MSILCSNPSLGDAKSYLASFGLHPQSHPPSSSEQKIGEPPPLTDSSTSKSIPEVQEVLKPSPVIALVKIQGPFTNNQLESICRGLVYLEKLGLVSVIVVEHDDRPRGEQDDRPRGEQDECPAIVDEVMRVVTNLEKPGSRARPIFGAVVRLGPKPGDTVHSDPDFNPPETHALPSDLITICSALSAGEIPIISPFALDSFCWSVGVDANEVVAGLTRGMVEASSVSQIPKSTEQERPFEFSSELDLMPLRLMVIDRTGGVPLYARSGYPHLLINLVSEHQHIHDTFDEEWRESNPSALSHLALARKCLTYLPPTSSAIMVSHKSPSSSLLAIVIYHLQFKSQTSFNLNVTSSCGFNFDFHISNHNLWFIYTAPVVSPLQDISLSPPQMHATVAPVDSNSTSTSSNLQLRTES